MWKIAWYNLYRDKARFVTAVVGLVFAVVLMAVQASIFFGAISSSSLLAREMDGDLWIVPGDASNADFSVPIPSRRRYQALGVPGVERTGRMIVGFSALKFPDGRQEALIVVGTDTDYPWLQIDPAPLRLRTIHGRGIMLDERERWRFGIDGEPLPVGSRGELRGHRVFVAGYVDEMASFTPTPYLFCSYKAALDFTSLEGDKTVFVMVKCEPGADVLAVRDEMARRIPDIEVLTKEEFAGRSSRYWVMGTGMGMSLALMSVLALIVGVSIVGQTFVTGTLIKLREYGTLKALGFTNRFVAGVILAQGVIVAMIGYVLGSSVALIVSRFSALGGTAVKMDMTPMLFVALLPLTLVMCVVSSLVAGWRVFRLAPAEVFR
jgi:putative ABC transport system permease protein